MLSGHVEFQPIRTQSPQTCRRAARAALDCLRAQFAAIERGHPDHVLISAEDISHLDQSAIEALGSLTHDQPATVILYLRRWSELLPSLWQERVKHGHDEALPDFLAAHLADPSNSPIMNHALAIERYAAVLGRANIAVVSYSQVCDAGIDLAEHFFDTFLPRHRQAIDGLPPPAEPRPNRSLPPREIEVVRALNAIAYGGDAVCSNRLRDWYFAHADRFDLGGLHGAIDACLTTIRVSDASPQVRHLRATLFRTCRDLLVEPVRSIHGRHSE